jgi:hypothetical protein
MSAEVVLLPALAKDCRVREYFAGELLWKKIKKEKIGRLDKKGQGFDLAPE